MVEKINFYHGITDVLQIDHSQMPMKKLNLVEDVVHAAEKSTTAKQFFMSMRKIKEKTAKKVDNLLKNINRMRKSEGGLRAEIRIPLNRAIQHFKLLESILDDEFVGNNSIILDSETVSKYLKFQVALLSEPIFNCLTKIRVSDSEAMPTIDFKDALSTISAFESLLQNTLFAGSTRSYMYDVLWSKSNPSSFDLCRKINVLNRLDFTGERWVAENLVAGGSMGEMRKLIEKHKLKNGADSVATFKAFVRLREANSWEERANILWSEYHDYIVNKHPEDFVIDEKGYSRPKEYLTTSSEYNAAHAASLVFNSGRIDGKSSVWRTPYLVAYVSLRGGSGANENLEKALSSVAEQMPNLFLHVHGDKDHFYAKSTHRKYVICRNQAKIQQQQAHVPSFLQRTDPKRSSLATGPSLKCKFSRQEHVQLCKGLNTYSDGINCMVKIASDERLGFLFGSHNYLGKPRTNVDLKDKLRNLEKRGLVTRENGLYILKGSNSLECAGLEKVVFFEREDILTPPPTLPDGIDQSCEDDSDLSTNCDVAVSSSFDIDNVMVVDSCHHPVNDDMDSLLDINEQLSQSIPSNSPTWEKCTDSELFSSDTEQEPLVPKKKYKRLLGSVRAWKIVGKIFPESTKTYYNALLHIPINRDEPNQKSWSSIHRDHITKAKRDLTRWNILLQELVKDRLVSIVQVKSKKNQYFAIRKFKAKSKK